MIPLAFENAAGITLSRLIPTEGRDTVRKVNMKTVQEKLIEETLKELSAPERPKARSRVWKDPKGYTYLVQWSNTVLLRYFVRMFTSSLPKSEYRRKAQLDDAARSVVRNMEEGYKRSTTSEYINFIGYSQGSLEEVGGDIRELTEDGFLASRPNSSLQTIGINLKDFNIALKSSSHPLASSNSPLKETIGSYRKPKEVKTDFSYRPINVLYPPLKNLQAKSLTYEIFIELINKTDFLLRKLVESLEKKLSVDQKAYQITKLRIQDAIHKRL